MLKNLNIEKLAQHLILSNTPLYLYKKYSRDESLIKVSNILTSQQLSGIFNEYINKKDKSFEDIVVIYAVLIAITLKKGSEAKDILSELDTSMIKWGDYIKSIYLTKLISQSITSIDAKYEIKYMPSSQNTFSNNSYFNTEQKPHIIIL